MKQIGAWISEKKLNTKFNFVIGLVVFIPICFILLLIFQSLNRDMERQTQNNLRISMSQDYSMVQKTVDMCNSSTQSFLGHQNLKDFLIDLKKNRLMKTGELISFQKNDIGMLERLVNSNPYLYQIRVYAKNNNFSEMLPILYREERLDSFAFGENYVSGKWQFDYEDQVMVRNVNPSRHTMGLITDIVDFSEGCVGVIEVAVRMETVFQGIFNGTDEVWSCFVDENGEIYSDSQEESCKWEEKKEAVIAQLKENKEEAYYKTKLLGEHIVIGILPVPELSGYLVELVNVEKERQQIRQTFLWYLILILVSFAFLCLLVNRLVNSLLKQFYGILTTVEQIGEGDLEARIQCSSQDEMGTLGVQINKMLDTIENLMYENINRELLMKNSEIKALQNQINAHFIYNVLESIKMMAEVDEKYEISDAVTSLGKLLRYGMKWSSKNVTIGQEIEYIKDYLDLINLRFDYVITLALNIPEHIYKQEIPKISLQPIVENAIYHGIEELAEDASIYIKAVEKDDDFYIEITDSGKGMGKEELEKLQKKIDGEMETQGGSGNGIGLKNVQDRIRISFGEHYGISIASKEECYTKVIVKLPITYKEG